MYDSKISRIEKFVANYEKSQEGKFGGGAAF